MLLEGKNAVVYGGGGAISGAGVGKFSGIDVSFNASGLGDTQDAPLVWVPQERFALPVVTVARTHLLTAAAAIGTR